ncbi:hypothetical protein PC116_g25051 [Phytophthora cactorum]|nr:hypothetical protein PC119_g22734 [Phytophthora cactorum]KAG4226542.1 hypothetical protein PC116_g25051 [Phytophthora cactorum]
MGEELWYSRMIKLMERLRVFVALNKKVDPYHSAVWVKLTLLYVNNGSGPHSVTSG